jgi:hypothetical protein
MRFGTPYLVLLLTSCGWSPAPDEPEAVGDEAAECKALGAGQLGEREGPIPTAGGVPTGDCRNFTDADRTANGCPAVPRYPCEPCAICRYDIEIEVTSEVGKTWQTIFTCDGEGLWTPAFRHLCGQSCAAVGPYAMTFDGDCKARAFSSCDEADFVVLDGSPAQVHLDGAFRSAVAECAGATTTILDNRMQLEIEDGCPTRFSSTEPLPSAVQECLTMRFADLRWDCARDLACTSYFAQLTE